MGGSSKKPKNRAADYLMSVHYGICSPVEAINKIWINEKMIDFIPQNGNATIYLNQYNLNGGSAKNGGPVGYIDLMFGRDDQLASPALAKRLGLAQNNCPGFRGISSIFFYGSKLRTYGQGGFTWTANMPSLPPVWVNVTRQPRGPFGNTSGDQWGNANFAYIIYECLVSTDFGMGCPLGLIDMDSFLNSAAVLASESMFGSVMWARSDTVEAFIGECLDTIQATLGSDPLTGKLKLKLLRNDYNRANLPIVHPGNAKITKMQRKVWGETTNEITVTYTNPDNEEEEAVTAQDLGNIAVQGVTIPGSRNYYAIRHPWIAMSLAYRDLRQSASPLLSVSVEMNRTAWDEMVGDVMELRWPEYGITSIIMRIVSINYGKPGSTTIVVDLLEDIFSFGTSMFTAIPQPKPGDPAPTYPPPGPGEIVRPVIPPWVPPPPQGSEWVPPGEDPRAIEFVLATSAPYIMLARIFGDEAMALVTYPAMRMMVLASQSGIDTQAVELYTNVPDVSGTPTPTLIDRLTLSGTGTLRYNIAWDQTVIDTPINWVGAPAAPGQFVFIVGADGTQELCAVSDMNDFSLTLIRGGSDTLPRPWLAGTRVWFADASEDVIEPVTRADGEMVTYRFLPVTSRGTYPLDQAGNVNVRADDRAYLPLRPANVRVNTSLVDLPDVLDLPIAVTWSRRNRITETAVMLSWTDPDMIPEAGQTTTVHITGDSGMEVTHEGIAGTQYDITAADLRMATNYLDVEIWSERDNELSRESITRRVYVHGTYYPPGGYGQAYGKSYGRA